MAKFKHLPETKAILEDIKNRLIQLQEANEHYKDIKPELVEWQNTGLQSAQMIVQQAIDNGSVNRGNEFFPDPLSQYNVTPKEDK